MQIKNTKSDQSNTCTIALKKNGMINLLNRTFVTVTALILLMTGLMLHGCGSGGGESSTQVVSGTAAVGAPMSGQVSLKDSSNPTQSKTTVIGPDGSFAFDVTNLKAPFILQAEGLDNGKLHSFAAGPGLANVNPFSEVLVASVCDGENPETVFSHPDAVKLDGIKNRIDISTVDLLEQLRPLLQLFNAADKDPIKDHFIADHQGLDGVLDLVNFTIIDGFLTISNKETDAVIFTGNLNDLRGGHYSGNDDDLPHPMMLPVAPNAVEALGGSGQVTLTWESVSNATTYNVYYSTSPGVTKENGTKISAVTTPYVQTGLTANSTFYYVVTAVNGAGESAASELASATTNTSQPTVTVPTQPTAVFATGGTNQVTLSWAAVTNATSYNVYYSASSGGVTQANGILIPNATSPAVFGDLTAGTTYYYIVTAVNSAGEGSPSVQAAATTLADVPSPTIPGVPTGVTALGGTEQATITWANVSGAASYNLYWSTSPGVTKISGAKVAGVSSPYIKTGLSAGTTYYFIVAAVNSVGESAASNQATATTNAPPLSVPNAPTGLTSIGGAKQVTLSWSAVSGATSYNIYWSTTPGVTTSSTKITTANTTYVQTGLAASTAYYYIVTAVNTSGQSVPSAQVTATTNAPVVVIPAAPTAVTATGGVQQVTLTWATVTGATSYNIYWTTSSGAAFAGTKITGANSPYVLNGLADNTIYYSIITAVNSAGEGPASTQVSATTNAAPQLACGTCHSIPPASGEHDYHVNNRNYGCDRCHGTGYSKTTVNAATHDNGVLNFGNSLTSWNAGAGTCTSSCHGSRTW
jgi:fibronectin type 3 domain-containing protein